MHCIQVGQAAKQPAERGVVNPAVPSHPKQWCFSNFPGIFFIVTRFYVERRVNRSRSISYGHLEQEEGLLSPLLSLNLSLCKQIHAFFGQKSTHNATRWSSVAVDAVAGGTADVPTNVNPTTASVFAFFAPEAGTIGGASASEGALRLTGAATAIATAAAALPPLFLVTVSAASNFCWAVSNNPSSTCNTDSSCAIICCVNSTGVAKLPFTAASSAKSRSNLRA
jgi:hypothetical protein